MSFDKADEAFEFLIRSSLLGVTVYMALVCAATAFAIASALVWSHYMTIESFGPPGYILHVDNFVPSLIGFLGLGVIMHALWPKLDRWIIR